MVLIIATSTLNGAQVALNYAAGVAPVHAFTEVEVLRVTPTSTPEIATTSVAVTKADPVACNCYALLKTQFGDKLPRMAEIKPNYKPDVGRVAIFMYGNVKHVALITEMAEDGFYVYESNYKRCKVTTDRFVKFDDPKLLGIWYWDV